jgi:hypothetical protein
VDGAKPVQAAEVIDLLYFGGYTTSAAEHLLATVKTWRGPLLCWSRQDPVTGAVQLGVECGRARL